MKVAVPVETLVEKVWILMYICVCIYRERVCVCVYVCMYVCVKRERDEGGRPCRDAR